MIDTLRRQLTELAALEKAGSWHNPAKWDEIARTALNLVLAGENIPYSPYGRDPRITADDARLLRGQRLISP